MLIYYGILYQKWAKFLTYPFPCHIFIAECLYGGQAPGSVLINVDDETTAYNCYEFTSSENKFELAVDTKHPSCRYRLVATLKKKNGHTILANAIFYFGERRNPNRDDSFKCNLKIGERYNVTKLRRAGENYVCAKCFAVKTFFKDYTFFTHYNTGVLQVVLRYAIP